MHKKIKMILRTKRRRLWMYPRGQPRVDYFYTRISGGVSFDTIFSTLFLFLRRCYNYADSTPCHRIKDDAVKSK